MWPNDHSVAVYRVQRSRHVIEWPIKKKRISIRYASFGVVLLFAKSNRRQCVCRVDKPAKCLVMVEKNSQKINSLELMSQNKNNFSG